MPSDFLDPFPSIALPYATEDDVSLTLGVIEAGHRFGWTYVREANGSMTVTPYNWSQEVLGVRLQFSREEMSVRATLPFGQTTVYQTEDGGEFSYRQSASIEIIWDGWNTTSEVAYNSVDYEISGGSELTHDNTVSGHQGIYVRDRPIQVVGVGLAIEATLAVAFALPETLFGLAEEVVRRLATNPSLPYPADH